MLNNLLQKKTTIFYNGKVPYCKEFSNISITHSDNYAAVLLSEKKIGIDLQKEEQKIIKLKNKFLSKEKEKNNELENMSFEDAINELEKIVDELEGNEISLDEAVNAYERGSKLKNICQERLNEAKMKVEKIKDFDKDEI